MGQLIGTPPIGVSLVSVVGGGNMTRHALALKGHPGEALVASAYILLARASHMAMYNFNGVGKCHLIMCPEGGKLRHSGHLVLFYFLRTIWL